jgi:glutaredoxin
MFKLRKILIAVFLLFLALPVAGQAAGKPVELYFFEGQGCPHCARMKSYLEGLKADYPNLSVKEFEVYFDKDNQDLFTRMGEAYGSGSNGVPMVFIGEETIVGEDYEKLKSAVEKCSDEGCVSPLSKIETANSNTNANINENVNVNENRNTNRPASGNSNKNEIVGWTVIGIFAAVGIGLIIYLLKGRK